MTRENHAQILANILAGAGDPAIISEQVTLLSEDYAGLLAQSALMEAESATLRQQNQSLIDQNMKLFLKVGAVPEPEKEPEETIPSFDSLFDENGNLK
jgi:hypothetical protein